MLVYLNVFIYSVQFSKTIFFHNFRCYFLFFLSPSSDLLSISLDLDHVNNFFQNFFALFSRRFLSLFSVAIALSDVFYLNINGGIPINHFIPYKRFILYILLFSLKFSTFLIVIHPVKYILFLFILL